MPTDAAAGVGLEPDRDHRLQRAPERGLVHVGVVAADHAALAQRPDPPQAGGRRDADPLGERVVGQPGVPDQLTHQPPVDLVELARARRGRPGASGRRGRPAAPNTIL